MSSNNIFEDAINNLEDEINQYLDVSKSSFPIIKYVIASSKKLKELKSINPTNQSITTINERITKQLESYKYGVLDWCNELPDDIEGKFQMINIDILLNNIIYVSNNDKEILEAVNNVKKSNLDPTSL